MKETLPIKSLAIATLILTGCNSERRNVDIPKVPTPSPKTITTPETTSTPTPTPDHIVIKLVATKVIGLNYLHLEETCNPQIEDGVNYKIESEE
jgi:hypothetical protein